MVDTIDKVLMSFRSPVKAEIFFFLIDLRFLLFLLKDSLELAAFDAGSAFVERLLPSD